MFMTAQLRTKGGVSRRRAAARLAVHLVLIATAVVSLVFEPVLALHIGFGLAFVLAVAAHLAQRRTVSRRLVARVIAVHRWPSPTGRLAITDALLFLLTAVMLISGLWDWLSGHPTRIRFHALSGLALAVFLLVHTLRRRRRLRASAVR
jgi:hypothetical protein